MRLLQTIGSIIAAASAVTGLLVFFIASARGRDIRERTPRQRLLLVILLLIAGTVLGVATLPSSQPKQSPASKSPSREDLEQTSPGVDTTPLLRVSSSPASLESPEVPTIGTHQESSSENAGVTILDDQGEPIPSLVAVVRRMLSAPGMPYAVTGLVRTTGTTNAELDELITTEMTLQLTMSDAMTGTVLDATTIRARGGGFTIAASRQQALERVSAKLEVYLRERGGK